MCLNFVFSFLRTDYYYRFRDIHEIMGTRISLIQSLRDKERRRQIGSMMTSSGKTLMEVERRCLLRLSQAARESGKKQIALNAVFQAERLSTEENFKVLEEFASVLWQQNEQKQAVQILSDLRESARNSPSVLPLQRAEVDARLVSWVFSCAPGGY